MQPLEVRAELDDGVVLQFAGHGGSKPAREGESRHCRMLDGRKDWIHPPREVLFDGRPRPRPGWALQSFSTSTCPTPRTTSGRAITGLQSNSATAGCAARQRAEPQENVRPPGQRRPPAGRPDSHPGAGRSRTPGAGSRCSPPPSARCTLFGHTTLDGIDRDHADALLAEALADTGGWLNAVDRLLDRLRRPNDRDRLVDTPAGAAAAAAALGLPDDDHWAHGMAHTAVTDRPQGEAATPPRADH